MIRIENGKKSYDGRVIWENLNLTFSESGIYCLMGPSGQGKTTLLRCLAGLETLDGGTIPWTFRREDFHGVPGGSSDSGAYGGSEPEAGGREGTAALAAGDPSGGMPGSAVSTFSGGMKRRAAVARAMAVPSAILLMDEPFTGLDERTRDEVISYILRYRGDRMLLLTTHEPEDVEKLGAECVRMDQTFIWECFET